MAEDKNQVLAALSQAIEMEKDGKEFYLKAASEASEEKAQEMFRSLADDEEAHLRLFQRQYDSIDAKEQWEVIPEAKDAKVPTMTQVFPMNPEEIKRTAGNASDLEVLVVGMEKEMQSFALYNAQAFKVSDPAAKDMYLYIAGQEQKHFDTLMSRYQSFSMNPGW